METVLTKYLLLSIKYIGAQFHEKKGGHQILKNVAKVNQNDLHKSSKTGSRVQVW
jgi:hypothetical protein